MAIFETHFQRDLKINNSLAIRISFMENSSSPSNYRINNNDDANETRNCNYISNGLMSWR